MWEREREWNKEEGGDRDGRKKINKKWSAKEGERGVENREKQKSLETCGTNVVRQTNCFIKNNCALAIRTRASTRWQKQESRLKQKIHRRMFSKLRASIKPFGGSWIKDECLSFLLFFSYILSHSLFLSYTLSHSLFLLYTLSYTLSLSLLHARTYVCITTQKRDGKHASASAGKFQARFYATS